MTDKNSPQNHKTISMRLKVFLIIIWSFWFVILCVWCLSQNTEINKLSEASNVLEVVISIITVGLVYMTYTTQKEELLLTRQELKNSAEMMRQQKEIMEEEKFRNYFSFLLEQKEKYADGFYEQIGYENLDVKENSYIDLMNEIIQTNTDVLSNKEKGEKLKNIKSKNLQSISEYMLDEYDKEYIIWSNYDRNLIEIYNAWLQKNNLVWKHDSPQWLMLPSIKLNTTNNVPLSLEEEKNIATNFCIEVREYLDDKSRFDYLHLQWLIETIEKYEHDNNIIQSILEYQNLIDALEEEIKNIFIKVDPQNQKKITGLHVAY